jgi:hypothetical protein
MGATFHWYNTEVRPLTDLQLDIGTATKRFNNIYGLNLHAGGLTYTWPTAYVTNGFLRTSTSGVLSWSTDTVPATTVLKYLTD